MHEWHRLCLADDVAIDGDTVTLTFRSERTQRVKVEAREHDYRLTSTVVGAAARRGVEERLGPDGAARLALRVFERNRSAPLVGFRIAASGKLAAEAYCPIAGVTREEFLVYLRAVAREADRMEYLLTGQDRN